MSEEYMRQCAHEDRVFGVSELKRRRAIIDELLGALKSTIPTNVCLTNANVPDSAVVCLDVPMGELRRISAVVAKHTGEQS